MEFGFLKLYLKKNHQGRQSMRGGSGVIAILLALGVQAEVPQFCSSDCNVYLSGIKRQRVYVRCDVPTKLTLYNSEEVVELPLSVSVPVGLLGHTHTMHTGNINLEDSDGTVTYDPYYHIAKSEVQKGYIMDMKNNREFVLNFGSNLGHNATVFLVTLGTRYDPEVLELLGMPMTQFLLHGSYWSKTTHWYVFAITTGILSILYGLFSRVRIWQYVLLLSIAAFVAVFASQLHQILLIVITSNDYSDAFYQGLFVNALAANLFPVLFAMVFMYTGRHRPKPWSALAIVVGVASLFMVGAGWYVGPVCLFMSGVIRAADRLVLSTVSVVR